MHTRQLYGIEDLPLRLCAISLWCQVGQTTRSSESHGDYPATSVGIDALLHAVRCIGQESRVKVSFWEETTVAGMGLRLEVSTPTNF